MVCWMALFLALVSGHAHWSQLSIWPFEVADPENAGNNYNKMNFYVIKYFYSSRATFLTQRRGVHENDVYIEDRRPTDRTTDLAFWKISNGHISATPTGHPIHFMFGSRLGFSRSADRIALLPVEPNPRCRQAAILENFKWPYLCNGSSDRLRVWS